MLGIITAEIFHAALVDAGHHVLNTSFHSTSLLPGAGAFVRSKLDLKQFLQNI
jgi:hypothetical protein